VGFIWGLTIERYNVVAVSDPASARVIEHNIMMGWPMRCIEILKFRGEVGETNVIWVALIADIVINFLAALLLVVLTRRILTKTRPEWWRSTL
jgi:hypothetical protein